MVRSPDVIVFDVNETLSDMAALGEAFSRAGAPPQAAPAWFAGILRDGFALAATGGNTGFAEIARQGLTRLLGEQDVASVAAGTEVVMTALLELDVHPDVVPGVEALAGVAELVTLSNGAASLAEDLLRRAGVGKHFTRLLSVEDAPAWKPARTAYEYAVSRCGTEPGGMLLVAVHPWDIHGARAAGWRTAWLNRTGATYPTYFAAPDLEVADLPALARVLGGDR